MLNKLNKYRNRISFYLRKKVNKKYVILESDDWGLERAKDKNALEKIIEKYGEQNCSRWTKDSLETAEDLDQMFDLFSLFENKFDKGPVLTANFITHNLDYSSKDTLQFKPISEGYNFGSKALFEKYREGIDKKYFIPQLHGFSHYDTSLLERDFCSENFHADFKTGFPLAKSTIRGNLSIYRGECFDPNFDTNIVKAVEVFKSTFGFYSKTFIPPHYSYTDKASRLLSRQHICLLQSTGHFLSANGAGSVSPLFRKKKGLHYSGRNTRLDTHPDYNYLAQNCIRGIETAFVHEMPAVIDIHRVNFSGTFSPETRKMTLEELNKVFVHLYQNHPDVIFLSSDALISVLEDTSMKNESY
jgi:hypothetical protein